jgi:hypothetical protein
MAQVRKKQYERDARIRQLREGLMPWARPIPWRLLGYTPRVLCLAGFVAAVSGLGAWGMMGPFAAAALQVAADLQRRRRTCPASARLKALVKYLVILGLGIVLLYISSLWGFMAVGWLAVSVGVWACSVNVLILVTLIVSPVRRD